MTNAYIRQKAYFTEYVIETKKKSAKTFSRCSIAFVPF